MAKIPVRDISSGSVRKTVRTVDHQDFQKTSSTYRAELEAASKKRRSPTRRRSKDSESGFRRKSSKPVLSWAVSLTVGLLFAGFIGVTFVYFKSRAKEPIQEVKTSKPVVPADPTLPESSKAKWAGILPKTIAEKFMAAKTDEERLLWVSDASGVAEMMSRFFQSEAGKSEVFTKLTEMPQSLGGQESNVRFTANFTDGSTRLVAIKYDETGAGKVDFKCYSRHCDASWVSLLDGSVSKASEMRCILIASDYYNHDFTDESVWLSLLATSPDFEDVIYLYVKRDDPDFAEFLKAPPRVQVRFIVRLESVGISYKKRQFRMVNPPRASWLSP